MAENDEDEGFARAAHDLADRLLEAWEKWDKNRRWYKWLSIIQLFLAYLMLACSSFLFVLAGAFMSGGACCQSCGQSMGSTVWFDVDAWGNKTYSHTQDDGAVYKCLGCILMIAGFLLMVYAGLCYGLSYLFLALTFISCYEEIQDDAPTEIFVLSSTQKRKTPNEMNIYETMNRNSTKVGMVSKYDKTPGQHVYTGWIRTFDDPPRWIYCNRRGRRIFKRFPNEEGADKYISQAREIELSNTTNAAVVKEVNPAIPEAMVMEDCASRLEKGDTAPASAPTAEKMENPIIAQTASKLETVDLETGGDNPMRRSPQV